MGTHPIFESDFDCLTEHHCQMDRDRPETIHEDEESAQFNRENVNPLESGNSSTNTTTKDATPNSCRKRAPLGLRHHHHHRRNRQSPKTHSSPRGAGQATPSPLETMPAPSPRAMRNPFDEGGCTMSPRALGMASGVCTPSSVTSGGWTLEQKSSMFPATIDDHLVDSQYESPYTAKGLERSKLALQSWLQQTDLTSPWSETKDAKGRLSLTSQKKKQLADSTTQTNLSLPVNFNLLEFLQQHNAPLQPVTSSGTTTVHQAAATSNGSSANSSLRRKLFDAVGQLSDDSDHEDDDYNFVPLCNLLRPKSTPPPSNKVNAGAMTPPTEQFSSSPKKVSPCVSSPGGALSVCGGANEMENSPICTSPYRSPFRSPFGDPNLSLSPIPKLNVECSSDDDEATPVKGVRSNRALRFSETKFNGTNDFDEGEVDERKKHFKNRAVAFSSMDHSFDVSMASNEWGDVSAIPVNPNATSIMVDQSVAVAESTRIKKHQEDDVYMASFSQESRGFSFCENNDDGVIKEGENLDSGFASNPNSRTGSVLCDKQPQQPASSTTTTSSSIPLPVFPMIYESDHAK